MLYKSTIADKYRLTRITHSIDTVQVAPTSGDYGAIDEVSKSPRSGCLTRVVFMLTGWEGAL